MPSMPAGEIKPPAPTYEDLARCIDHEILRPESVDAEVAAGCEMAQQYGIAAVIVQLGVGGGVRPDHVLDREPDIDHVARMVWIYSAAIVALVVIGGLIQAQLVTPRLERLLRGMEEVREGKYPSVPAEGKDELTQMTRGFNQTVEISRCLASEFGVHLTLDACRRTGEGTPQALLPWKKRATNVRNAFSCEFDVSGKSVAVVDDVLTTGATLNELARTLKRHGAREVVGWIVARTPAPDGL